MSITVTLWPIVKALLVGAQFMNLSPYDWQPVNPLQETLLAQYAQYDQLSLFNDQEMRAWASTNIEELNDILKKENFSIQLDPRVSALGVVSILDVAVTWLEEGQKTSITTDDKTQYPAVQMKSGFEVYSCPGYEHPIVCCKTKSNDTVWMTIADKELQNFDLLKRIEGLQAHKMLATEKYDSIKFPMVDLDQEVDIEWLLNMNIGREAWISQALQQTKFKMNEQGARVKSAVAIGITRAVLRTNDIIIDKPFYLWIERPGLSYPVFAAYITPEDWKDPQNLEL